jgi:hypothetical protein
LPQRGPPFPQTTGQHNKGFGRSKDCFLDRAEEKYRVTRGFEGILRMPAEPFIECHGGLEGPPMI